MLLLVLIHTYYVWLAERQFEPGGGGVIPWSTKLLMVMRVLHCDTYCCNMGGNDGNIEHPGLLTYDNNTRFDSVSKA